MTPCFSTSLYANASVSKDDAYQITKAVMESQENLQRSFDSMKG